MDGRHGLRQVVTVRLFLVLLVAACSKPAPELRVYGTLPAFRLTSDEGKPFGSEELRGRVWVADFIFTRCPTVCPLVTQHFAQVQEDTKALDLTLVSFSVDPANDTPPVLAAYAKTHGAIPGRWLYLTGEYAPMRSTVNDSFKVGMDPSPDGDPANLLHGTHFVLVDRELRIRGYYRSDDAEARAALVRDAGRLLAAPK
jgi:protein SCO1